MYKLLRVLAIGIFACMVIAVIVSSRPIPYETDRYEYFCDRTEHNFTTNKSYAVVEVYDKQTGDIYMMDIELR